MKSKKNTKRQVKTNSIKLPSISIFIGFGFYAYLALYLSEKRVIWPFVDDWVLLKWLLGTEELSLRSLFSQINGHQHVVIKLMLFLYGKIFGESLFGFSLISLALGISGFGLILYAKFEKKFQSITSFVIFFASALAILATPRQLQNYFLPICAPWMLSIFFIGLYIFARDRQTEKFWKRIKLVALFVSPFCNGLGLVVPIYEIILWIVGWLSRNRVNLLVSPLVAVTAVFFSNILPRTSPWFDSPGSAGSVSASLEFILSDPLAALKFLLLALAQPFLTWHGPNIQLGLTIGAIEFALILFLLKPKKGIKFADNLYSIFKNECLIMGIVFLGMFQISRFGELGVLGAVEPRYTTGMVILIIGILLELLKLVNGKMMLGVMLTLSSLSTWNLGFGVGNDYHEIRFQQSIQIENCFYVGKSWDDVASSCKELILENIIGLPETEVIYLLKYIKENEIRF